MLTIKNGLIAERLDEAKIYTMSELNQRTAQVIEEINDSGRPALITKHGRFMALITPLRDATIESLVLSQGPLAEEMIQRASAPATTTYSADDMSELIKERYRDNP
jgi:prevent-host-death family protein